MEPFAPALPQIITAALCLVKPTMTDGSNFPSASFLMPSTLLLEGIFDELLWYHSTTWEVRPKVKNTFRSIIATMNKENILLKLNVVPCTFIERLNRFVALVEVNGETRKALITNTGRLEEFMVRGRRVLCTPKSGGKTDFVLVAFEDLNGKGAIVDTRTQAKAFEKAVELGLVPWLKDCSIKRKEVTVGKSRLDYLFECPDGEIYAEMKSAVLRGGDMGEYAMYPDCPSTRGQKHIRELISLKKAGKRAMIFFIGAMPGVERFKPYEEGDPEIARLLREAVKEGVETHALSIALLPGGEITLENPELEIEV